MWAEPRGSGKRVLKRSWGPRSPAGALALALACTGAADFAASSDIKLRPSSMHICSKLKGK